MSPDALEAVAITPATPEDVPALLEVQRRAFQHEADRYDAPHMPPMVETEPEALAWFDAGVVLKAVADGRLVGSVRGRIEDGACYVARLSVDPSWQNRGLGRRLMLAVEEAFPGSAQYTLITGERSENSVHLYESIGYRVVERKPETDLLTLVYMEKRNRADAGPAGEAV